MSGYLETATEHCRVAFIVESKSDSDAISKIVYRHFGVFSPVFEVTEVEEDGLFKIHCEIDFDNDYDYKYWPATYWEPEDYEYGSGYIGEEDLDELLDKVIADLDDYEYFEMESLRVED